MQHIVLTDPKDDALLANGEVPVVSPVILSGSADAIPITGRGEFFITTAGVDATTLATPTAGGFGVGQDGAEIVVTDVGGHAHTITLASNILVPSHHLLTFNGTAGSFVRLKAYNGLWYVRESNGVTAS